MCFFFEFPSFSESRLRLLDLPPPMVSTSTYPRYCRSREKEIIPLIRSVNTLIRESQMSQNIQVHVTTAPESILFYFLWFTGTSKFMH